MSVLFPYPPLRYDADQAHIIAIKLENSTDPKVKEAAPHIRRAADLLYEATNRKAADDR